MITPHTRVASLISSPFVLPNTVGGVKSHASVKKTNTPKKYKIFFSVSLSVIASVLEKSSLSLLSPYHEGCMRPRKRGGACGASPARVG